MQEEMKGGWDTDSNLSWLSVFPHRSLVCLIVTDIYFVADILTELFLYIFYIPIGFRKALR